MATPSGGGGGGDFIGEFLAKVLGYVFVSVLILIGVMFIVQEVSKGVKHTRNSISAAVSEFLELEDEPRTIVTARQQPVVDQICAGSAEHPESFGDIATNLTGTVLPEYGAAFQAIAVIESRGDYAAKGPVITDKGSMYYGDRAYGKYQIMGDNIPSWSKEVLDVELTPEEFLANNEFQDIVAYHKVVQTWKRRDGNILDVAATWQSGRTYADAEKSGVGDGITETVKYARIVERNFNEILSRCKAEIGGSGEFAFPTNCQNMTSDFGLRTNPETGKGQKFHHGLDIGGCPADAVNIATMTGEVTYAEPKKWANKCGVMVEIEGKVDEYKVKTRYCHFAENTLRVKKGDKVKAGDILGTIGTTGHKSGRHCHIEVHVDGETVDVEDWFKAVGITPPYEKVVLSSR